MNGEDLDELLEKGLSGGPPRREFREQVLRGSMTMFVRGRQRRARWRAASLSAAAVLIAAVSFLVGRSSLPPREAERAAVVTPVPRDSQAVAVPSELVAWLEAARFFRQLGMEDRMARAVDRASKLLPCDTVTAGDATGSVLATVGGRDIESEGKHVSLADASNLRQLVEGVNRIMARCLGD